MKSFVGKINEINLFGFQRMRCWHALLLYFALLIFSVVLSSPLQADTNSSQKDIPKELLNMSLEELMDIEIVTSVEGTANSWFNTPSAVYVITAEDIRRSGHRTIADALRMVPGLQVLQDTSSRWQVTSRGFSVLFANKLLVLIDGRTVYDPYFSGTYWDIQDVILEDIDHIEVIRGPGATLWGANAVNGVINITTKRAKDTQGTYLTGGLGNYERGFGAIRYGDKFGEETHYRIWAKYFNKDQFKDSFGNDTHDDWGLTHGGFRIDRILDEEKNLTVQGDGYNSDNIGEYVPFPIPAAHMSYNNIIKNGRLSGGNLLFRLEEGKPTSDEGYTLQGYYEHVDRVAFADLKTKRDTVDLDWRHRFTLGDNHKIVWGLGWRLNDNKSTASEFISFDPAQRMTNLYSVFIQDTMVLAPDKWFFMIGTKFEKNDFTYTEWQPSGRIWYTPDDKQMFWAAVSRPVRTPTLNEDDIRYTLAYVDLSLLGYPVPPGTYSPVNVTGNTAAVAEKVTAYELGYRLKASDDVTIDTTFFYNEYRDILTFSTISYGPYGNLAAGKSYGIEELIVWQIAENWHLEASHSYMFMSVDPQNVVYNGNHIPHMIHCRSYLDITEDLEFNIAAYWQESRKNVGVNTENERSVRLDAGLTWRPTENLELAAVGQNLLNHRRFEANDDSFHALQGEVPRAFYIQATYRF